MKSSFYFHPLSRWILFMSLAMAFGYLIFRPKDWTISEEKINPDYRWLLVESYPHRVSMFGIYEAQMALKSPGLPAGFFDYMNRRRLDSHQWAPSALKNIKSSHDRIPFDMPYGRLHVSTLLDIRFVNFLGMFWHVESPDGHQFIIQRMDTIGLNPIFVMNVYGEVVYNAESTEDLRKFIKGEHGEAHKKLDHNLRGRPHQGNQNE